MLNSKVRKCMAVVSSVTIVLSGLLFGTGAVTVLAAMDPVFNHFEKSQNNQVSTYYDNKPNAPVVPALGIVSELVTSSGAGHEGSDGAMRLSYTMDYAGETGTTGHRAMFSVANTNMGTYGSFKPQAGVYYKLTLWYKGEYLKSDADILLVQGTGNLQTVDANPPRNRVQTITRVFATETPGDWTQASVVFTGLGNNNNVIIDLNMVDHRHRSGTSVLFDDIAIEELTDVLEEGYESFEAKNYTETDVGGIRGNGSGREVSTEQNHTPGGSRSVKLNMNQLDSAARARTVVTVGGSDLKVRKGKRYAVSFWAYSPEDITYICRIGSVGNPTGNPLALGAYVVNNETGQPSDPQFILKAGVWKRISIITQPVAGHASATDTYLTIDGAYNGWTAGNAKPLYIDDVTVDLTAALPEEGYEAFAAKNYDASNTDGIRGNGSGREVSADFNHTPGGSRSVKLNMNQQNSDTRARTVINVGGTDLRVIKGQRYTVSFWVYSPEAITYIYRIGSIGNPIDFTQNRVNNENGLEFASDPQIELAANTWTRIVVTTRPIVGSAATNTHLTIDGAFPGASNENAKPLYIDDVMVQAATAKTVAFDTNGCGDFPSREAYAGNPVGTLPAPARAGYVFGGWYAGGEEYTAVSLMPNVPELNLRAKWIINPDLIEELESILLKITPESEYDPADYNINGDHDGGKDIVDILDLLEAIQKAKE